MFVRFFCASYLLCTNKEKFGPKYPRPASFPGLLNDVPRWSTGRLAHYGLWNNFHLDFVTAKKKKKKKKERDREFSKMDCFRRNQYFFSGMSSQIRVQGIVFFTLNRNVLSHDFKRRSRDLIWYFWERRMLLSIGERTKLFSAGPREKVRMHPRKLYRRKKGRKGWEFVHEWCAYIHQFCYNSLAMAVSRSCRHFALTCSLGDEIYIHTRRLALEKIC